MMRGEKQKDLRRCVFFLSVLLVSTPAFAVLDITPGGEKPASVPDTDATVEKGAGTCSSDAGCSLTVRTADGRTAYVVLNEGDSMPTCEINRQAAEAAKAIPAGTPVTIHVNPNFVHYKQAHDFYYLCGSDATVTAK